MIKVDMDNGIRYAFDEYDNYFIDNQNLVVEKGSQWIGCFSREHMIGFFAEEEKTDVLRGAILTTKLDM